jgi:hypothetical protein
VQQDLLALRETKATQATLAQQVLLVLLALKVFRASRETLVIQVQQERLAQQEPQAQPVLLA